jgi:hypothetical protein
MRRCQQRVSDECKVKAVCPHSYAMQFFESGLFAIVRVEMATAKDGRADAVVISESFAEVADAWTDARMRLEMGSR